MKGFKKTNKGKNGVRSSSCHWQNFFSEICLKFDRSTKLQSKTVKKKERKKERKRKKEKLSLGYGLVDERFSIVPNGYRKDLEVLSHDS